LADGSVTVVDNITVGVFHQFGVDAKQAFVWQLFTEGIAMYFEQVLVGDLEYYHQNRDGWRDWCEEQFVHYLRNKYSFEQLLTMKIDDVYKKYLVFVKESCK